MEGRRGEGIPRAHRCGGCGSGVEAGTGQGAEGARLPRAGPAGAACTPREIFAAKPGWSSTYRSNSLPTSALSTSNQVTFESSDGTHRHSDQLHLAHAVAAERDVSRRPQGRARPDPASPSRRSATGLRPIGYLRPLRSPHGANVRARLRAQPGSRSAVLCLLLFSCAGPLNNLEQIACHYDSLERGKKVYLDIPVRAGVLVIAKGASKIVAERLPLGLGK